MFYWHDTVLQNTTNRFRLKNLIEANCRPNEMEFSKDSFNCSFEYNF